MHACVHVPCNFTASQREKEKTVSVYDCKTCFLSEKEAVEKQILTFFPEKENNKTTTITKIHLSLPSSIMPVPRNDA